jgi:hypothetical protein
MPSSFGIHVRREAMVALAISNVLQYWRVGSMRLPLERLGFWPQDELSAGPISCYRQLLTPAFFCELVAS